MKRSFVRYVSHEIRTPLNAATLGLQLLEKEVRKQIAKFPKDLRGNQIMELVGDTGQAITIAIDTLNDLLLYEKIDGGLLALDAQEVVLWPYIEEVLKIFKVQVCYVLLLEVKQGTKLDCFQAKALELELLWHPLPDSKIFVNIDRYKMSQVIRNVVSNALKFSEAGQKVIVGAEFIPAKSSPRGARRYTRHSATNLSSDDVESQSTNTMHRSSSQQATIASISSSFLSTFTSNVVRGSVASLLRNTNDPNEIVDRENTNHPTSNNHTKSSNADKVDMIRIFVTDFGPGISKVFSNFLSCS